MTSGPPPGGLERERERRLAARAAGGREPLAQRRAGERGDQRPDVLDLVGGDLDAPGGRQRRHRLGGRAPPAGRSRGPRAAGGRASRAPRGSSPGGAATTSSARRPRPPRAGGGTRGSSPGLARGRSGSRSGRRRRASCRTGAAGVGAGAAGGVGGRRAGPAARCRALRRVDGRPVTGRVRGSTAPSVAGALRRHSRPRGGRPSRSITVSGAATAAAGSPVSARAIQSIGGPPGRGSGSRSQSRPPDRISRSHARVIAT